MLLVGVNPQGMPGPAQAAGCWPADPRSPPREGACILCAASGQGLSAPSSGQPDRAGSIGIYFLKLTSRPLAGS